MPIFMTIQEQIDHMIGVSFPVEQKETPVGPRWFITMGNPGFNSPANNGFGYKSEGRAWAAIKRYGGRGWADRVTNGRST